MAADRNPEHGMPGHPAGPERPAEAAQRPGRGRWARTPQPGLGDGNAVRDHRALDPDRHAPAGQPLDPDGGPVCEDCGRQHPRPVPRDPLARLVRPTGAVVDPRQARPAGWGRDRGGDCW
jgi:hypothetical protein